jgi:hypothetical protein
MSWQRIGLLSIPGMMILAILAAAFAHKVGDAPRGDLSAGGPEAPTSTRVASSQRPVQVAASYRSADSLERVSAEFIGVIVPLVELEPIWPVGNPPPAIAVFTRWLVRVETAYRGPFNPGDTFVFAQPGGPINPEATLSTTDGVTGDGYRPKPGGEVIQLEFLGAIPMIPGRAELVFVSPEKGIGSEPAWLVTDLQGRYLVNPDGSLQSTVPAPQADVLPVAVEVKRLGLSGVERRLKEPTP